MNQLNTIIIEGNACRDAELKHSSTGTPFCKMSIAINRFYKSGDGFEKEVSFFDVDTFGETAKLCAEKVRKGDEIRITGRLKQNRWTGTDGTSRTSVVIVANNVEFRQKQNKEKPREEVAAPQAHDGFSDDIPF
jgi:single-strand DNA-binding protein